VLTSWPQLRLAFKSKLCLSLCDVFELLVLLLPLPILTGEATLSPWQTLLFSYGSLLNPSCYFFILVCLFYLHTPLEFDFFHIFHSLSQPPAISTVFLLNVRLFFARLHGKLLEFVFSTASLSPLFTGLPLFSFAFPR